MLNQINKIREKIELIMATRKYENLQWGTKELGEGLKELKVASKLLEEKHYEDLKAFYNKKPFYFKPTTLFEIMKKHPEVSNDFISMVKNDKNRFKIFYKHLESELEYEFRKLYQYKPNDEPLNRVMFIREFLSHSKVYQKGVLNDSAKDHNNMIDICEHMSMDIIEVFSDDLLELGMYKKQSSCNFFKSRLKFIDDITNEDNKNYLLTNSNEEEKVYLNRIFRYFEKEKECWNYLGLDKVKRKTNKF